MKLIKAFKKITPLLRFLSVKIFCLIYLILSSISSLALGDDQEAPVIPLTQSERLCTRVFFEETVLDPLSLSQATKRRAVKLGLWDDRAQVIQDKINTYAAQMQNLGLQIPRRKLDPLVQEVLQLLHDKGIVAKAVWVPYDEIKPEINQNENSDPRMIPVFEFIEIKNSNVIDQKIKYFFAELFRDPSILKLPSNKDLRFFVNPFLLSQNRQTLFLFDHESGISLPLLAFGDRWRRKDVSQSVKHEIMHALTAYRFSLLQNQFGEALNNPEKNAMLRRENQLLYEQLATEMQWVTIYGEIGLPFQSTSVYSKRFSKNEEMAHLDVGVLSGSKLCESIPADQIEKMASFPFLIEIDHFLDSDKFENFLQLLLEVRRVKEFLLFNERLYPFLLRKLEIPTDFELRIQDHDRSGLRYLFVELKFKVGKNFKQKLEFKAMLPFWAVNYEKPEELLHYRDEPLRWTQGIWIREKQSKEEGLLRLDLAKQIQLSLEITQKRLVQLQAIDKKCQRHFQALNRFLARRYQDNPTHQHANWSEERLIRDIDAYLAGE